ncbi:MAG: class I SAM-dependent methyltransferase [Rubripirellula sp.]
MIENYTIDEFGVIHQIEFEKMAYDREYLSYYEDLSDRTIKLGYQRMGWILGSLGRIPDSILEIGYGTGSFIEAAHITGVAKCFGCDIVRHPLPSQIPFLDWDAALEQEFELVAMFDVLEHIPDLSFLSRLKTTYLAIAVPFCRWRDLGDEWFDRWRMRLPNEHLHHFDPPSLRAYLAAQNYVCLEMNTFEDGIRLRDGETGPNVLSGLFRRQ